MPSLSDRQRFILGWSVFTVPLTLATMAVATWALPPISAPDDAARLAHAARCIAIAALPLLTVIGHVMVDRLVSGAHNPLLGEESERLRIHLRVLQNTLEQFTLFAAGAGACAVGLPERWLHALTVAAVAFVVGRMIFWRGYLQPGTLGRAPGVQITACVTFTVLPIGAGLAVWEWIAG